ncbi:MAG: sulfur oxidation c-type cytochrome SoxX [Magnetospirillum sp.]|nr:MAG: sulfur oxidation c-type cytochrome SoxX [Magnetospirillum sp.]
MPGLSWKPHALACAMLVVWTASAWADMPGDVGRGRIAVIGKGNCLACHHLPIPEEPDHGDIGPDLSAVGSRLTAAELAARIKDPKIINPDTIMPSFLRADLHRVAKNWQGKTILSSQEVADVVAYLLTLK